MDDKIEKISLQQNSIFIFFIKSANFFVFVLRCIKRENVHA